MRNIRLDIAYDGTNYYGWQYQPGRVTLQGVLEDRLGRMLGEKIGLSASGRTDTGVHALGQVASFLTSHGIPPEALRRGINSMLPRDILVTGAREAEPDFHARFSARDKTYVYRIFQGTDMNPFERNYAWHVFYRLDLEAMQAAARHLWGRDHFGSFRGAGCSNKQLEKTVYEVELTEEPAAGIFPVPSMRPAKLIRFKIRADGFLRHMVRNIVGTLVEIGRGQRRAEDMPQILAATDRTMAGTTAPAQGLFLAEVGY